MPPKEFGPWPRLSGSIFQLKSIDYVMAGLDPAIHAMPAAPVAPRIVPKSDQPEGRHRVGVRVKPAHDEFGGKSREPDTNGPWQTVSWWVRRFVRRMLFQTIHDVSVMLDRERVGRGATLHRLSIGCAAGTLASSARLRALWTA